MNQKPMQVREYRNNTGSVAEIQRYSSNGYMNSQQVVSAHDRCAMKYRVAIVNATNATILLSQRYYTPVVVWPGLLEVYRALSSPYKWEKEKDFIKNIFLQILLV